MQRLEDVEAYDLPALIGMHIMSAHVSVSVCWQTAMFPLVGFLLGSGFPAADVMQHFSIQGHV